MKGFLMLLIPGLQLTKIGTESALRGGLLEVREVGYAIDKHAFIVRVSDNQYDLTSQSGIDGTSGTQIYVTSSSSPDATASRSGDLCVVSSGLIYQWNGSQWISSGVNLKGVQGDQGPQGVPGLKGDVGANGVNGIDGLNYGFKYRLVSTDISSSGMVRMLDSQSTNANSYNLVTRIELAKVDLNAVDSTAIQLSLAQGYYYWYYLNKVIKFKVINVTELVDRIALTVSQSVDSSTIVRDQVGHFHPYVVNTTGLVKVNESDSADYLDKQLIAGTNISIQTVDGQLKIINTYEEPSFDDSSTIDLSRVGNSVTGSVKISSAPYNLVNRNPDGIYVGSQLPASASTSGQVLESNGDGTTRWSNRLIDLDNAVNDVDGIRNMQSNLKRSNGVIVPLYIYPTDPINNSSYNNLIDLARRFSDVPTIVALNPSSGPGTVVDGNYTAAIDRLTGASIQVIGYVSSAYMDRSLALVKADALKWTQLYPRVRGIWVDEMPNGYGTRTVSEIIAYYHELYVYCKSTLNLDYVYVNPGSTIEKEIWDGNVGDNVAWYETSGLPTLAQMTEGSAYYTSMWEIPKHCKTVIAHSVATWNEADVKLVKQYNGWIYITNDVMPNPYDSLSNWIYELYATLSSDVSSSSNNALEMTSDGLYVPKLDDRGFFIISTTSELTAFLSYPKSEKVGIYSSNNSTIEWSGTWNIYGDCRLIASGLTLRIMAPSATLKNISSSIEARLLLDTTLVLYPFGGSATWTLEGATPYSTGCSLWMSSIQMGVLESSSQKLTLAIVNNGASNPWRYSGYYIAETSNMYGRINTTLRGSRISQCNWLSGVQSQCVFYAEDLMTYMTAMRASVPGKLIIITREIQVIPSQFTNISGDYSADIALSTPGNITIVGAKLYFDSSSPKLDFQSSVTVKYYNEVVVDANPSATLTTSQTNGYLYYRYLNVSSGSLTLYGHTRYEKNFGFGAITGGTREYWDNTFDAISSNVTIAKSNYDLSMSMGAPALGSGVILSRIVAQSGGSYNYMQIFASSTVSATIYGVICTLSGSTATVVGTCTFSGSKNGLTKGTLNNIVNVEGGKEYFIGIINPTAGIDGLLSMTPNHLTYSGSTPLYWSSGSTTTLPTNGTAFTITSDSFDVNHMPWVQLLN